MSEPVVGAEHPRRNWGRIFLEVLGAIAAVATILGLVFNVQERIEILGKEEYEKLVDLKEQYERGDLIAKSDCPIPEAPLPVNNPRVDQTTILTAAFDQLIQEAGFLARFVEEPDFFDRFDRWRSNAKNKLADGQKLISESGWTSNEDWVETFHSQTHIKRDLGREPYQPEEYRGFLQSGSKILERMKHEINLQSVEGISPAGSPNSTEG